MFRNPGLLTLSCYLVVTFVFANPLPQYYENFNTYDSSYYDGDSRSATHYRTNVHTRTRIVNNSQHFVHNYNIVDGRIVPEAPRPSTRTPVRPYGGYGTDTPRTNTGYGSYGQNYGAGNSWYGPQAGVAPQAPHSTPRTNTGYRSYGQNYGAGNSWYGSQAGAAPQAPPSSTVAPARPYGEYATPTPRTNTGYGSYGQNYGDVNPSYGSQEGVAPLAPRQSTERPARPASSANRGPTTWTTRPNAGFSQRGQNYGVDNDGFVPLQMSSTVVPFRPNPGKSTTKKTDTEIQDRNDEFGNY